MKRRIALLLAAVMALSLVAGPAVARPPHFEESHGHMLILGADVEVIAGQPTLVGWRKCKDMPVVPLNAHHANIHMGQAGVALMNAGHAFVPSFNFPTPWESCADFATFLPFPIPN